MSETRIIYHALPTLMRFHECGSQHRCIVGPVGSGKTAGVSMEVGYYLPWHLFNTYGMRKTRGVIVRNTYPELRDTTMRTMFEWFPDGKYKPSSETLIISYAAPDGGDPIEVEILFRSCDTAADIKKFKSLEITWYWIDESIEVSGSAKRMLKNRIGRYPQKSPVRFGIETTNPPDVEHPLYHEYSWTTPPPGPIPQGTALKHHTGFWQPPHENDANLRPGYYDDIRADYADNPDWIAMYIEGKPGVVVKGKLVYNNYQRSYHVSPGSIPYTSGCTVIRGWDASGNTPAAFAMQIPTARRSQILREWTTDKEGIVDFTKRVCADSEIDFPGAEFLDYGDPAGAAKFSKSGGGFTSNHELMAECGVIVVPGESNLTARIQAVDQVLALRDGLLIDPSCIRIIGGFDGGYCYPEIGTTGEYGDKPLKNKYSHPHDAIQHTFGKIFPVKQPKRPGKADEKALRRRPAPMGSGWMG
jgi:hypothetical protein